MFQIENKLIIYRICPTDLQHLCCKALINKINKCAYYYVNENDQYNKISGMPRIFDGK